jgi:urease accessory protein
MRYRVLPLLSLTLFATGAQAHGLPSDPASVTAGFAHPFGGLDHMLAMIAVGLWSALAGGSARWAWPAAFVALMAGGYALGTSGAPLPWVDHAVLASVVALGLLVALAVRLPTAVGAFVVGLFALFHGHAHGAEAPLGDPWLYALGVLLATATLHGVGLALGHLPSAAWGRAPARVLGGTVAATGVILAVLT